MANPNSDMTQIIVTTLDKYSGVLADNVLNHNALLSEVFKKGNVQKFTASGNKILQEMMYADNATVKWYSGLETLDTSDNDVLTSAQFDIRQLNANVVVSGLEEIQNASPERVHDITKAKIKVAEKSLMNAVGTELYNDGSDSKKIGGLRQLIADTPTSGTVGNINRATYTFWRNQTQSLTSAGTIQSNMNTLWLNCRRGADKPDVITADSTYYTYYENSLQTIHRVNSDTRADAGFESIMYKGTPVYYDENCPSAHMYFINTDYLFFRTAKGRNFSVGKPKMPTQQDGKIIPIFWAGNLTLSNAALQGVLKA